MKKLIYTFGIIALTFTCKAQKIDTTYINNGGETVGKEVATYYLVSEGSGKKFTGVKRKYSIEGILMEKTTYAKFKKQGPYFKYDPEKQLKYEGHYSDNRESGIWSVIDSNNDVIGMEIYTQPGTLARRVDFNTIGDKIYSNVEEPAHYTGGAKAWSDYVKKNIRFPREATKARVKGKVLVRFYVMKDGSLMNIEAIRSPHPSLSKEAIRIISEGGSWVPGKINGKAINSIRVFPVTFNSLMF